MCTLFILILSTIKLGLKYQKIILVFTCKVDLLNKLTSHQTFDSFICNNKFLKVVIEIWVCNICGILELICIYVSKCNK